MGSTRDQTARSAGAFAGYAVAIAITTAIVVVRVAGSASWNGGDSFLPFVLAIIAAAWFGRVGPGLLATLLGAAAQMALLLRPHYDLRRAEPRDIVQLGIFILIGILLSYLCRSLRRAREQFVGQREALEQEATLRRNNEQLLGLVTDHAPVSIISCDAQYRFRYVNRVYSVRYGKDPAEIIGRPIVEVVGDELFARIKPRVDEVLTGKPVLFEIEVPALQAGPAQHLRCAYEPEFDHEGKVTGYVAAIVDISERTQMEQQLRQAADRLRLALGAAGMIAWEWELASGKVQLVGQTDGDTIDKPLPTVEEAWQMVHPSDVAELRCIVEDAIARRGSFVSEFRFALPNGGGSYIWMEVHASVSCDSARRPQKVGGVMLDITARKSSAEEIERAALLVQNSDDFIAMCDMQYVPVYCNKAGLQLVGLDDLDHLKRVNVADFFYPEDQPRMKNEFFPAVLRDGRGQIEIRFRHFKTREPIWMKYSVLVMKNAKGEATGLATISENITQRKLADAERARVEEALRLSRERLDLVVNSTELGLWYCDLPFDKLVWNHKCKEHFGVLPSETVTINTFFDRLHPEDRKSTQTAIEKSIADQSTYDVQYRTIGSHDGRVRWIRAIGRAFYDEDGKPRRFDGITVDVTSQKRAEQALRESESYFRSMADNAPAILWVTAPTMECTYLSRQWYEFTGRTAEQELGFGWFENIHPEDRAKIRAAFETAHQQRMPLRGDCRLRRRDGEYRWVVDAGLPRFDEDGTFQGFVGCVIDVHDRKAFEQALEEADRRKDEFLATLAHELRNPLAPIRTSVNMLQVNRPADPELAWAQDVIVRQVQQMARLLDDLLDVSRITRGKLELRKERVPLASILQIAVETSRPLIDASEHNLDIEQPPETILLDADQTRLAQALSNLLNNAAKYTDPGGQIRLTVKRHGSDVVISVLDNGIGIPADKLPSVFEMFTQVDPSLERTQGGLGIGLTLVKRLIEMHGGTIEARSDGPGLGSEFVIHLPVAVEGLGAAPSREPAGASTPGPHSATKRKILVADDNRDAARSLSMLLRMMGSEVRTAHDGIEAVEAAAEFKPDLALLDIGMPRMNGYDAARQIRQQPNGRAIMLVALTGWGQEEDKRLSVEAGFDQHLVKPLEPQVLENLLGQLDAAPAV